MIRLLGATLLAAGCAWIGFRASWEMRARGRAMGEVAEGLELLERELELGGAPLPHLVDDLSGRTRGQPDCFFRISGRRWSIWIRRGCPGPGPL